MIIKLKTRVKAKVSTEALGKLYGPASLVDKDVDMMEVEIVSKLSNLTSVVLNYKNINKEPQSPVVNVRHITDLDGKAFSETDIWGWG